MRIVVTGREGQIVRSLAERAAGIAVEIISLGRPEFDLSASADDIAAAVKAAGPDVIVSAAAYTRVDRAEAERDLTFAINEAGPRALAGAARCIGVPMVHLSTDYVFDGSKDSPYIETDNPRPAGVYGASKLAGEQAVLEEQGNTAVLRTAWVYSPFGSNFVKTMLRLAGDRNEVSVVADQRGNPSSALDIADGILRVAANLFERPDANLRGVFHMTGGGEATWAEFAEAIFAASAQTGGPVASVKPIFARDFPTAARRPANSRLDSSKLAESHGVVLPDWRSSLPQVVARLVNAG